MRTQFFETAAGSAAFFVVMLMMTASAMTQTAQDFTAILANPDRPSEERALDAARKPDEVLKFYGVKAGDKVADIWAGRGYYTAILAQVVGPKRRSLFGKSQRSSGACRAVEKSRLRQHQSD